MTSFGRSHRQRWSTLLPSTLGWCPRRGVGSGGEGRSEHPVSIPVHSSPGDGEGELPVGCESGLNFNYPKGPEKLMVGGEG